MADEALSEQFRKLYTEWGDAIANQRHDWLDGFFTDDFLGTAQPWPTLNVNRQQMIELDKAVEAMDTEWIRVCAHRFGDDVITVGYVRYNREDFRGEAPIGEGMPTGADIAKQTKGKVAAYLNGWRFNGERWQVFDHHLIQLRPDEGF
jgi:hypothetical protein